MIKIQQLNRYCLKRVEDYRNIDIYGKRISTPFFINKVEQFFIELMRKSGISENKISRFHELYKNQKAPYAWYIGKGTPEEIQKSVVKISNKMRLPLKNAGKDVILGFMKLYGLGVDCSGFVYNLLNYALSKHELEKKFNKSLNWKDRKKQGASRAGSFVFAGKASSIIDPINIRPLDLILTKSNDKKSYDHIAIILRQNPSLVVAQSTLSTSGISVTKIRVDKKGPRFEFKPEIGEGWENLYKDGRLEFRRLNILSGRSVPQI